MPFDDVHGFPPVAISAEQRHDAATCRGERQVPDVGEGWRELRVGDFVQIGDEFFNGSRWHVTTIGGGQIGPQNFPYRRRVTPVVPEAPQSRPAETRASSSEYVIDYDRPYREWNERADAEVARRAAVPTEVARLRAENATLRSEVERLRLRPEEVRFLLGVKNFDGHLVNDLLQRQGGGE